MTKLDQQVPEIKYLKDYKATSHHITHVDLIFDIFSEYTLVESTLHVTSRKSGSPAATLNLNGVDLELEEIFLDDTPLKPQDFEETSEGLTLFHPPESFILRTLCRIYPQKNTTLEGLYQSSGLYCTQCEAEGFRKITYFLDRPDNMSTYQVTINAPRSLPVLLSNGNCIETGELPDFRHYAIWSDPFPKPCYLFALVAGDLGVLKGSYVTRSGKNVSLGIYTQHDKVQECRHALESLKKSMTWDEETYGLECDLDEYNIVAVHDFNMGAMENKGLNIFNSRLLLSDGVSTTDQRYRDIEGVIAHEYFHNWTGNRVTCRDWFQLCLKEGLTVFRDSLFSQDMGSADVVRIQQILDLKNSQFPEDAGPMAHPPRPDQFMEINNFYTATVYQKGAEIVRMLHTILGAPGFRAGMALYFQRFDGQAVTQEDFIQAMGDANQRDLSDFMRWYTQAGTPRVTITTEYKKAEQTFSVTFTQSQVNPTKKEDYLPLRIPVRCGLLSPSGAPLKLMLSPSTSQMEEVVIEVTQPTQTVTFHQVSEKPVPSFFRQLSAPVIWNYAESSDQETQEMIHLIKYDTDPLNRWDSAQKIWLKTIQGLMKAHKAQKPLTVPSEMIELFGYLFTNQSQDLAFTSLLWNLPSYKVISLEETNISVEGIFAARNALEKAASQAHHNTLVEIYQSLVRRRDDSFSKEAMGIRAMKNSCLSFLAAGGSEVGYSLALEQFRTSKHMSDTLPALRHLVSWSGKKSEDVLEKFHRDFQNDSSSIDDWFRVQASCELPGTILKVKQLLHHPLFKLSNPNRMRSVLASFCHNNPLNFHHLDGSGYELCSDYVLKLDKFNPQMSTSLARAFLDWKRHTPERQTLISGYLQKLIKEPKLSSDLYEIITKALE